MLGVSCLRWELLSPGCWALGGCLRPSRPQFLLPQSSGHRPSLTVPHSFSTTVDCAPALPPWGLCPQNPLSNLEDAPFLSSHWLASPLTQVPSKPPQVQAPTTPLQSPGDLPFPGFLSTPNPVRLRAPSPPMARKAPRAPASQPTVLFQLSSGDLA